MANLYTTARVSDSPFVYTSSDDGVTWTAVAGSMAPTGMTGVTPNGFRIFGSSNWVILGGIAGGIRAWQSTNQGTTWSTLGIVDSSDTSTAQGFLASDTQIQVPEGFVVASQNSWASFTRTNPTESGSCSFGRATGSTGRILAGGAGTAYYSDDGGNTWNSSPFSVIQGVTGIAYGFALGQYVAVGQVAGGTGLRIVGSSNGVSWSTIYTSTVVINPGFSKAMLATPAYNLADPTPLLVTWQEGGGAFHVEYANNGSTFTTISSPTGLIAPVSSNATWLWRTQSGWLYRAEGNTPTFQRSVDGQTWTNSTIPGGILMQRVLTADTGMIPASSVEFPHYPDRGLPIEIAGPRNDQTRRNYLPTVRIFTS